MEFGLAIESSSDVRGAVKMLVAINSHMQRHFRDREYGGRLKALFIGVIVLPEDAMLFHPVRPFMFKRSQRLLIEGVEVNVKGVASFDIQLDHKFVGAAQAPECWEYLTEALVAETRRILTAADLGEFDTVGFLGDLECEMQAMDVME